MSIDWDSLTTLEEWAGALKELLSAATVSIQSGDTAKRVAAEKTLIEFVMQSPNSIAIELDELARGAVDALGMAATTEALASIAGHMAELAKYLKQ